jgi:probable HAF family extracellular repeat protein
MDDETIFHLALATQPSEREARLDEACQGDAELRAQVERLLAEHDRQQSFLLDKPPSGLDATTYRPVTEGPGDVIGPYKLLESIGEGGFGVVFLAEHAKPVRRKVALKVIKPGMDTRQVVARFEFLWTPTTPGAVSGAMQDLGTLGGTNSYGIAADAAGHVVGAAEVPAEVSNYTHAFLYTPGGGMVDLNTFVDPLSGWELLDADGINDSGQITGQGLINDEYHAFLLTPVPTLPGDFDLDGFVNEVDLALWKTGFGASGDATLIDGDADGDQDVDGADFLTWQRHLGAARNSGATAAHVPEPDAALTFVPALVVAAFWRRSIRLVTSTTRTSSLC